MKRPEPTPLPATIQEAARAMLETELSQGAIAIAIIVEDAVGRYRVSSVPDLHSTKLGLLYLAMRGLEGE